MCTHMCVHTLSKVSTAALGTKDGVAVIAPSGVSATGFPREGYQRVRQGVLTEGGSLMSDACPCPTPVSQAPREAPARRAPSSALYLEEKSDEQKKEEVGVGGG